MSGREPNTERFFRGLRGSIAAKLYCFAFLALLAVDRVSIAGGTLSYRDLSAAKPTEYILQDMEVLLESVRLGQTPKLHVGMVAQPFILPVRLDGTFRPLKESTDIDAIDLQLALGKTDFTITGKTVGRNTSLNISAPVINTANLPVALPLQKPVDVKNLQIAAEVQGQDVLLQTCSFQLFDGQVTAQGRITSSFETPPFTGKMTIQGMQLGPALNSLAATQMSISGTTGADLAVQGRGLSMPDLTKSLEGTGHMVVTEGRIEGVDLLQECVAIPLQPMNGFPSGLLDVVVGCPLVLVPHRGGRGSGLAVALDRVGGPQVDSGLLGQRFRAEVGGVAGRQRRRLVLVQRELDHLGHDPGRQHHRQHDEKRSEPREHQPDVPTHHSS